MGTWVGEGLSSGVDTYLRTRAQLAREDEMAETSALRREQVKEAKARTAEREDLAEAARRFAEPNDDDGDQVQMTPGVPAMPGTPAAAPVEAAGAESMGGPEAAPAIPGTPGTPGTPGVSPVMKRYRTEASAQRRLGADLYGRVASNNAGREMLKQYGVTPATEIARQQKQATTMQEMRGMLKEADAAASDGRAADAMYKRAAAYELFAASLDDPGRQAEWFSKAQQVRQSAHQDSADPRLNEDYKRITEARSKLRANRSADNLIAFQEVATSAKTKSGQQYGMQALDADAAAHKTDQFTLELMDGINQHGTAPKAIAEMLKKPTPAFMAAVPELLQSKNSSIQRVFGLAETDELFGNGVEAKMAVGLTKAQGHDITTPSGVKALVNNWLSITAKINEAKKRDNVSKDVLVTVLKPQLDAARKHLDRTREDEKEARGTTARVAAQERSRQAAIEFNEQVDKMNEMLPEDRQLTRTREKLGPDDSKAPVVPTGDPAKVNARADALLAEETKKLGRQPTAAEKADIKARVKQRLQDEGLIAGPQKR